MSQMSASKLREIAINIENELTRLSQLETQIRILQAEIEKNPDLSPIFYESLPLKLHIVISNKNETLFSSKTCHRKNALSQT